MPATIERNEEIIRRYQAGERMSVLGRELGVPWQQVWSMIYAAGAIRWANGSDPRRNDPNAQPRTRGARQPRATGLDRLTFGIEIECTLPLGTCNAGSYRSGLQVAGLPTGWIAKSDCSIQPAAGYFGVEIVSPILRGADGARQIMAVCRWLSEKQARVNPSTGFHVHVGWHSTPGNLRRLVKLVAKNEKGLFAVTGTQSRETNRFCRPISFDMNYAAVATGSRTRGMVRYHTLNLTNLARGGKHTVEFRVFGGTMNAIKILTYVRICLGLVEKALGTSPEAEWSFNGNDRHSERGEDAARQLVETELGWTVTGAAFGALSDGELPTFAASLQEVSRLARKYDGNDEP